MTESSKIKRLRREVRREQYLIESGKMEPYHAYHLTKLAARAYHLRKKAGKVNR
jgi:hypothetical protein